MNFEKRNLSHIQNKLINESFIIKNKRKNSDANGDRIQNKGLLDQLDKEHREATKALMELDRVKIKYQGVREGVIELENQLSECKTRLAETTDYLKEEHHASLILANLYKDLDDLFEYDEIHPLLSTKLEKVLLKYKTQYFSPNMDEKMECIQENFKFLRDHEIINILGMSKHNSFINKSQADIHAWKSLVPSNDIYHDNRNSCRAKNNMNKRVYQSLKQSPMLMFKEDMANRNEIQKPTKHYVKNLEIEVVSQNSSMINKQLDKSSAINNSICTDSYEFKIGLKKKIEFRMQKELKMLIEENKYLKSQINKMKVFVPVSLLNNSLNDIDSDIKSWELTAKVASMYKLGNQKSEEKVEYLTDVVKVLVQRDQVLHFETLTLLEQLQTQKDELESKVDALSAKCESYQIELEKNVILKNKYCKELEETSRSRDNYKTLLENKQKFKELEKSVSDMYAFLLQKDNCQHKISSRKPSIDNENSSHGESFYSFSEHDNSLNTSPPVPKRDTQFKISTRNKMMLKEIFGDLLRINPLLGSIYK